MKTAYVTILTLTRDGLIKAVECPVIVRDEKIDFRIPAQNDPYLVCGFTDFATTENGRVYGTAWLEPYGIYAVDLYQIIIANLTNVESILQANYSVLLTGNLINDPSLFRNANEDYILYSTLYVEIPELPKYSIQVQNYETGEWVKELYIMSGDGLKFRIINNENPSMPIEQIFEFSTYPSPFYGRLESIQNDGFHIYLDYQCPPIRINIFNKDVDFDDWVVLIPYQT